MTCNLRIFAIERRKDHIFETLLVCQTEALAYQVWHTCQGLPTSGLNQRHHMIQGFGAVGGARSRSYFAIEESSGAGAGATLQWKTAPELEPEQLHICACSKALV